jgi:hypothetical protein
LLSGIPESITSVLASLRILPFANHLKRELIYITRDIKMTG